MCEILIVARGTKSLGTQADFTKLYSVLNLNQHASFQYWKDLAKFASGFSNNDSKSNIPILLKGTEKPEEPGKSQSIISPLILSSAKFSVYNACRMEENTGQD